MKIKIRNIDWDTDGKKTKKLPKSVTINDIHGIVDLDEAVCDWLNNTYGAYPMGGDFEVIGDRQERQNQTFSREIDRLRNENYAYSRIADFLYEHKECFADEQQKEIEQMFDEL